MRLISVKARETRFSKETYLLQIKAYDAKDIIDDGLFYDRKRGYDYILRRRLKHFNTTQTQRAKTKVMMGMVKLIFRYMMKILMRELLAGEDIEVKGVGFLRMKTFKFNNKYRGYGYERQKQKETNRNDMPLLYDVRKVNITKKLEYYISLHGATKKKHRELVKNGVKYLDK
jgi:hypothetical protein